MSAPGRRIATGRLRVDAARAVAKLREYQLLERRFWILEALRGAVGAGAESVAVDADSDDVWVAWTGEPPPEDDLGALLDELVSPAVDPKRRWARLLATAVNTALGQGTRWVDVWRIDGDATVGFRYAPALLQERDHDDQALRPELLAEGPTGAPTLPERGVLIQVRRRFGVDVMGRWLLGDDAPEVLLLKQLDVGARYRVPLMIGGEPTVPDHDVLVSVELGERSRMVLLRPEKRAPHPLLCRWIELGVPMDATAPGDVPPAALMRPVPAALLYDADRLPTNAARSSVRLDEDGLSFVAARAVEEGVAALVEATVEAFEAEPEGERRQALRAAMLTWIAAHAGGPQWRMSLHQVPRALRPFLSLKLARNSVGRWVDVTQLEQGAVFRSAEPLEADLEPWLGRIPWCPDGDPAIELFAGHIPASPRARLRAAERALRARREWMKHEPRDPVIDDAPGQWISLSFGRGHNRGRSALPLARIPRDFTGELCLLDPAATPESHARVGHLTLTRGGRPLAQLELASPIPYLAVIDSERFEPTEDYRGVVNDAAFTSAVEAATFAALRAVELLLGQMLDDQRAMPSSVRLRGEMDPAAHLPVLRQCLMRVVEAMGLQAKQVVTGLRGPLRDAPLYELWEEDEPAWVSLRQLSERFENEEAIVRADPSGPLPEGWPIVADPATAAILGRRFPRKPVFFYDPSLAGRRPPMDERAVLSAVWRTDWPVLLVDLGDARGAICWTGEPNGMPSTLQRMHRGVRIDQLTFEAAFLPCRVAMDDDRLIPNDRWDGVVLQPDLSERLGRFEQALCRALVDALAGDEVGGLRFRGDLLKMAHVHTALLRAATHTNALDDRRRARLWELPLIRTVSGEPVTLSALSERGEIAWVNSHESHLAWLPGDLVVADTLRAEALQELTGRKARHASRELQKARDEHHSQARLAMHRQQPPRPAPRANPTEVAVSRKGVEGVVAVGLDGRPGIAIEVRIEQRPFAQIERPGPPLRATFDVPLELATEDFSTIDEAAENRLIRIATHRMGELLERVVEHSPRSLHENPAWGEILGEWLDDNFLAQSQSARRVRDALLDADAWPCVQGGYASVAAASTAKQIRTGEPIGDWLGPGPKESASHLDEPALAIDEPHRTRVEQLAVGKKSVDLTKSMKRLQSERRIEQGLAERPRLGQVPIELKATIEELNTHGRKRWRIGEIGLTQPGHGRLVAYAGGRRVRTIPLTLEPPIQVALEASEVAEGSGDTLPRGLVSHLKTMTRRLLERRILPAAASLPRWVDDSIRRAWLLGGLLKVDQVRGLPLFETTAGARVSLGELEAQGERFGDVWVTTARSFLERTLEPADPERFAVRLDEAELAALASLVPAIDAAEELRLDDVRRRNLAKPLVDALELPPRLRPLLLGSARFDTGGAKGIVGLLDGTVAAETAQMFVHRAGRSLGSMPSPKGWPLVAAVDDERLTPDRTHAAPIEDGAWTRLLTQVGATRDEIWKGLLPNAPEDALAHQTVNRTLSWGSARGRLWMVDVRMGGQVNVTFGRIAQAMTPKVGNVALPLRGEVWMALRGRAEKYAISQELLLWFFERLCQRIQARAIAGDAEAFAVLLLADLAGARGPDDTFRDRSVPGLGFSTRELLAARDDGLARVRALLEPGWAEATPEPIRHVMTHQFPSWVLSGRASIPAIEAPAEPERSAPAKKTPKRTKPKPPKRAKPKPHPLDPLASALAKALRHSGAAASVVVAPRRTRDLVRYDESSKRLFLSGAHPQLIALQAERLAGGPNADRAMRLLIAHAVGVLDRALANVTVVTQRTVARSMMGQTPRH